MVAWSVAVPLVTATVWVLIGVVISVLAPGLILSLSFNTRAGRDCRKARARGPPKSAGYRMPTRAPVLQLGADAKLRQKDKVIQAADDDEELTHTPGARGIPAFLGAPETPREVARRTTCHAAFLRHSSMPHERPRLQYHPVPRELDLFLDEPSNLTVVLDLDETLVRSYSQDDVPVHLEMARQLIKLEVDCVSNSGSCSKVVSFLRPGLFEFLERVSRLANVYVYTAGDADYARPLIQMLDRDCRFFLGSYFREATVATSVHDHVKDLTRLGVDLTRTVLVDNNPYSFLLQPDNGILCESFYGEPDDRQLLDVVLPVLHLLARVPDVRPILRRRYNLAGWCQCLDGWCS